jgi:hypothetical protein
VSQAWVFQANPAIYRIDEALEQLEHIEWQVPQYTSDILPGDTVVIWRSGKTAGIVGVGTVVNTPRETVIPEEERAFWDGSGDGLTTRVRVRVRTAPFVAKETLVSDPVLGGHRIVNAPMGTVFPMTDEEWASISELLPALPQHDVHDDAWPASFSWEQRTKSVTPLPGGFEHYTTALNEILAFVDSRQPARDELKEWVKRHFEVTPQRAAFVVTYLRRTGLLQLEQTRGSLTAAAKRWMSTQEPAFLLALVHGRIRFIGEMLDFLGEPRTSDDILGHANERYGMRWSTTAQITRRRHFLGGLKLVEIDDDNRLRRTEAGTTALGRITLAAPVPASEVPAAAPTGRTQVEDPETGVIPTSPTVAQTPADRAVARLQSSAHSAKDPDSFERAVCSAFAFLGFDAVWLGGAGKTDVLLTAPLGADSYRVIIDAKTTGKAAVGDQQIDWITIDEHQKKHNADYAAIVGPAFSGNRVTERSQEGRSVALIDITMLAGLIRQHEVAPLDLHAYRTMFEAEENSEELIEEGEGLRRQYILAVEILRQVSIIQDGRGDVGVTDLYWNLDDFAQQFDGDRAESEEIEAICIAMSQPPLSLLRPVGDRYRSLGSHATQVGRLRLLADLLDEGAPEIDEDDSEVLA